VCTNDWLASLTLTLHLAGGSKKGSQVSYTRQVPKFLQAHAHLLGKGAMASMAAPDGATLVQDVDSDKEGDLEYDDGVSLTAISLCSADGQYNFVWPFKTSAFAALPFACSRPMSILAYRVRCSVQLLKIPVLLKMTRLL